MRTGTALLGRITRQSYDESNANTCGCGLPGGEALFWPDWLDLCALLPLRPNDGRVVPLHCALPEFLVATEAVVNEFFADPQNAGGEEILKSTIGIREQYPRAYAVKEARKQVCAAVKRMSKQSSARAKGYGANQT